MSPETCLSIILVSYNTRELLKGCLVSIYKTVNNIDFEVIIIDNSSIDGSPEMVESDFQDVRLIRNSENMYYAIANNQAMRVAQGRYVLLLNSDTIVKDGGVEYLVDFMENNHKVAAAGPKILNMDGSLQSKGFYFPSVRRLLLGLFGVNRLLSFDMKRSLFPGFYWGEDEYRKVDWVSGCCIIIRKHVVDEAGYLSEDFKFYYEEVEWCYRAKNMGYEVWYVPDSQIVHLNSSSPLDSKRTMLFESERMFYKKTFGIYKGVIILLLSVISICVNYIISSLIPRDRSKRSKIKRNLDYEIERFKVLSRKEQKA
jgi:hypothetical protein